MTPVSAISQQIWDMKYRLKTATGDPVDKTIEDSWRRVARTLANPEAGPEAQSEAGPAAGPEVWEARFFNALEDFAFMPAGRILAGAGTGRSVTLFNCFVMGRIPDDMAGIFESLKEAALTLQQGGGIGYDFSTLRPKGAAVEGVGADASGPLTFMDVWDAMCRTVMSAGYRRGAMMATLRCDHPDIEAFIEAKQEPGRLRMFNLSVLVTDAFMQAVRADAPWELSFGGATYQVVQARALWDRIMRATYAHAEPGVVFIDRINQRNNLRYCEEIHSCNPCVTGDTWVQTAEGPRQVCDLLGKPVAVMVDGQPHASGPEGFFATSTKPVLRLATREGPSLRLTGDHPVRRVRRMTRNSRDTEWTKARDLGPGDRVLLHDHGTGQTWPGEHRRRGLPDRPAGRRRHPEARQGRALGLARQPGRGRRGGAPGRVGGDGPGPGSGPRPAAPRRLRGLDGAAWRGEMRLALSAVKDLAGALGLRPGNKTITPAIERASSVFYRGFLRGLFDADGSVQGDQRKGVSLRLAQSNIKTLEAVQRMLLRLGIASCIYRNRRLAGPRALPDGKGGTKDYHCAAQHELIVSGESLVRYGDRIGFADSAKASRLETAIAAYKRAPNRTRFVATVASIEPDGVEPVFDLQVPGVNAFDANGLVRAQLW